MISRRDPAVNALARAGGQARARNLTPEERREAAKRAANARWDRYYAAGARSRSSNGSAASKGADKIHIIAEPEAHLEIWKKVQDHKVSANCPCDECIDSVISKIRGRYVNALARIDSGEKLDKEDSSLFQFLIGSKANRWTRVYRQALKVTNRRG